MSRLIDADALKRKAQKVATESWKMNLKAKIETTLNQFIDWIENAPTVESEPHWIPCSERLPNDHTNVLVWFEYFRYGNYNCLYQTHGIGDYSAEYDSWMINGETGWNKLRVIAWMPLPSPYQKEGDTE